MIYFEYRKSLKEKHKWNQYKEGCFGDFPNLLWDKISESVAVAFGPGSVALWGGDWPCLLANAKGSEEFLVAWADQVPSSNS